MNAYIIDIMENNDTYNIKNEPKVFQENDQYFFTNQKKIDAILKALNLGKSDNFVELGAGIGTFANSYKSNGTITLVEIDEQLLQILQNNFNKFSIIQEDAIKFLKNCECNKILANLPYWMTEKIFKTLKNKQFDCVLIVVPSWFNYAKYYQYFNIEKICDANMEDYNFPPAYNSIYLKLTKK